LLVMVQVRVLQEQLPVLRVLRASHRRMHRTGLSEHSHDCSRHKQRLQLLALALMRQREATREQVRQPRVLVLLLQTRLLLVLEPRPQQLQDAVLRRIDEKIPCPSQGP
jgi:hypothetical protein